MKSFGHIWEDTLGEPIDYQGHLIQPVFQFIVAERTILRAKVLHASNGIRQAITVSVRQGKINADTLSTPSKSVICWYDNSLDWTFECVLVPDKRANAVVKIWNSWVNKEGQEVAWVGYSGMIIEQLDPKKQEWIARCSSRMDMPNFDDLVFQFKLMRNGEVVSG